MTDRERELRKIEVEEEIARCNRKIRGKLASKIEDMKDNDYVVRLQNRKAEMLIIEEIEKDKRRKAKRARSKSKDRTVLDNMRKSLNRSYSREASRGRSDHGSTKQGKNNYAYKNKLSSKDSSGKPICFTYSLSWHRTTNNFDMTKNKFKSNHITNYRILISKITTRNSQERTRKHTQEDRQLRGEGHLGIGQKVPREERDHHRLVIQSENFYQGFYQVVMTNVVPIINERMIYYKDTGQLSMNSNTTVLFTSVESHTTSGAANAWKDNRTINTGTKNETRVKPPQKEEHASHQHCKQATITFIVNSKYLTIFPLLFLASRLVLPPTPPTVKLLPTQGLHHLLLGCVPLAAHYAQWPGCRNEKLFSSATIALRKSKSFSIKKCRQRMEDLMINVYRT